jgi:hypothetical protein
MALLQGNLISENNQSVETTVGGWGSFGNGSSAIAQSTTQAIDGTHSVACTRNATAGTVAMCGLTSTSDLPTTVAGKKYMYTAWIWSPVGGVWNLAVDWYQSGNTTYISTTTGNNTTVATSGWTQVGRADTVHVAPALGVTARMYVQNVSGTSTGNIIYVDQVYFGIPQNLGRVPGLIVPTNRASLI